MSDDKKWQEWFEKQSDVDKSTIAWQAIERLIELEEVRFSEADPDEGVRPHLYWTSDGEDMRIPF